MEKFCSGAGNVYLQNLNFLTAVSLKIKSLASLPELTPHGVLLTEALSLQIAEGAYHSPRFLA